MCSDYCIEPENKNSRVLLFPMRAAALITKLKEADVFIAKGDYIGLELSYLVKES